MPQSHGSLVVAQPMDRDHTAMERKTGGMAGLLTPPTSPKGLTSGTTLVNVTLKIHAQGGQGLPELGLVVCGSKAGEGRPRCEVKQVVAGTAAAHAMVRSGDCIARVNNMDVSRLEVEEVVALLRKAAIDYKWTYSPIRLQLVRDNSKEETTGGDSRSEPREDLLTLMTIAIRKNTKMVASKKPNPIRQTLLQRGFCDALDQALAANGYYDVSYTL